MADIDESRFRNYEIRGDNEYNTDEEVASVNMLNNTTDPSMKWDIAPMAQTRVFIEGMLIVCTYSVRHGC